MKKEHRKPDNSDKPNARTHAKEERPHRPTRKQLLFIEGLRQGKSEFQAAIDAGYDEGRARRAELICGVLKQHFPDVIRRWERRKARERKALLEGASLAEVARALGRSPSAIRRLMHRV